MRRSFPSIVCGVFFFNTHGIFVLDKPGWERTGKLRHGRKNPAVVGMGKRSEKFRHGRKKRKWNTVIIKQAMRNSIFFIFTDLPHILCVQLQQWSSDKICRYSYQGTPCSNPQWSSFFWIESPSLRMGIWPEKLWNSWKIPAVGIGKRPEKIPVWWEISLRKK
jgi:hypothetical protein